MDVLPSGAASLKWAKYLVRATAEALSLFEAFFQYGADVDPDELQWMRLHVIGTRATPGGTIEDDAIMTFDLVNITGGAVDTTWTTGDFEDVEDLMDTFWASMVSGLSPKLTISEYRWYRKQFAPPGTTYPSGNPQYFLASGQPERITSTTHLGTGSGAQQVPFQVALSVTEKTALAKHWGRWYIPNPGITMFDAFGRIAGYDFVADKVEILYAGLGDAELYPVVPSGAHQSLLGVSSIQVDDVPDVQRSRRPKTTLVRDERPAP